MTTTKLKNMLLISALVTGFPTKAVELHTAWQNKQSSLGLTTSCVFGNNKVAKREAVLDAVSRTYSTDTISGYATIHEQKFKQQIISTTIMKINNPNQLIVKEKNIAGYYCVAVAPALAIDRNLPSTKNKSQIR